MTQISKNGNSYGAADVSYIHFAEEQTGLLLPSCPGYPDWLPQLQLTKSGRLCFWNFPNDLAKTVISNPANKGTFQYCRDKKKITSSEPFPPVPYDYMMTNGDPGQYLWNSCDINGKMTQDVFNNLCAMEWLRQYWLVQIAQPGQVTFDQIKSDPSNSNPIRAYVQPGNFIALSLWDWIFMNVQYYIDQYLNVPYDVRDPVRYGKTWQFIFSNAAAKNDLQGWLGACNFLLQPKADPSTFDKVAQILPAAILTVVGGLLTVVSAGAATPLLLGAIGKLNTGVKQADASSAQSSAYQDSISNAGGLNLNNIPGAVSSMTTTQKIFLIGGVLLVVIIIVLIIKNRKK